MKSFGVSYDEALIKRLFQDHNKKYFNYFDHYFEAVSLEGSKRFMSKLCENQSQKYFISLATNINEPKQHHTNH